MNPIERARSALNSLDASCPHDEWVRIGMAAKSAGLDFDDFHNWSRSGANYSNEKDCKAAWKSFKEFGAITERTLFGMALPKGWQDPARIRFKLNSNQFGGNARQNIKKVYKPHNETTNLSTLVVWESCLPALATHDYIVRKQGKPDGLRYYHDSEPTLSIQGINVLGYLVVPCWSGEELQTLQFIPPFEGGKKLNLPGASFNDGYFVVDEIKDIAYVCEGLGQAWAANKATGKSAVVCFGAGRMMPVAKKLREKYPNACLVIAPDRGKEAQAAGIAATIDGHWVELPQDKPPNYDINDYAKEYGHENLKLVLERVKEPDMRYKLLFGADFINALPMKWIVQGVIPAEGLTALYGASGSGKSFLILDMAFAIAGGEEKWFDLRLTQAPVTYVCLEGESGIGKRIKARNQYYNKAVPDLLRFVIQPVHLLTNDISDLAEAITKARGNGGLVIIDTLNRAAPGADENSSVDMGNIIAAAKKLQSLLGGVVLLVHHTGKDSTKGLRGHSSLYAALDGAIEVIKTASRREWCVAKSKDDATGINRPFKLEIIKIGIDSHEEEITSCVAVPEVILGSPKKKPVLKNSSNQIIALEVISKLLQSSSFHPEHAQGKTGIKYDEALKFTSERMPTDKNHQKSSAQVAIKGLVKNEYLGFKGEWLWLTD